MFRSGLLCGAFSNRITYVNWIRLLFPCVLTVFAYKWLHLHSNEGINFIDWRVLCYSSLEISLQPASLEALETTLNIEYIKDHIIRRHMNASIRYGINLLDLVFLFLLAVMNMHLDAVQSKNRKRPSGLYYIEYVPRWDVCLIPGVNVRTWKQQIA